MQRGYILSESAMTEITLPDQRSLTQMTKKLNQAFIVLNSQPTREKNQFLKDFCKAFSEAEKTAEKAEKAEKTAEKGEKADRAKAERDDKIKKVWAVIEKRATFFKSDMDIVDPLVVLRDCKMSPYIGTKSHGVMFCKGMTIGLQLELTKDASMSYRLDFSTDGKLLHFNFELSNGKETYPLCIPLRFSTGRFGFTQKDRLNCVDNNQKMEAFLEATKIKFWLKMTIANTLITAPKNEPHPSDIPNEQLFNFVRGVTKYDLAAIKAYLVEQLPQGVGKTRINACTTELELLTCIMQKPVIRATARESIFTTLVTKDQTRRLLKDIGDLEGAIFADSEQRIDSEPAPQAAM